MTYAQYELYKQILLRSEYDERNKTHFMSGANESLNPRPITAHIFRSKVQYTTEQASNKGITEFTFLMISNKLYEKF